MEETLKKSTSSNILLAKEDPYEKKTEKYQIITSRDANKDYPDLSIVYTDEENTLNNSSASMLETVKRSLIDIQEEAKSYAMKRQKLSPSSFKSPHDCHKTASLKFSLKENQEIIKHLTRSIQELSQRLENNESLVKESLSANTNLKENLRTLESKFTEMESCKLETAPLRVGCACIII